MYITVCTNGDHLFLLVWERVSLLAQAGLKLQVFMPQPLQYWDYGCRTTPRLCVGFALFFDGLSERREALSLLCRTVWPWFCGSPSACASLCWIMGVHHEALLHMVLKWIISSPDVLSTELIYNLFKHYS